MKVRLFCSTHDVQSKESEEFEYPNNFTDEELDKEAEDYFWQIKEPCWWFERIDDKEKNEPIR